MSAVSNILTPELLKENEIHKGKLIGLIRSRDLFLMAGAGISKMLGMLDWNGLTRLLETQAHRLEPDLPAQLSGENVIVYTDRLLAVLGPDRFADIISDNFGQPVSPLPAHLSLVRLPFRAILTTNYDRLLVTAVSLVYRRTDPVVLHPSANRRETAKFLQEINDSSAGSPRVIHLHGYCDNPASIILSASQYEKMYGIRLIDSEATGRPPMYYDDSWPFIRKMMWALMATRRFLYVGFSMSDEYFQVMHEIVSEDARMGGTQMHFLIQRLSTEDDLPLILRKAAQFKDDYGIQTIFYEDDHSYSGLPNLIADLSNRVGIDESPPEPIPTPSEGAARAGPPVDNLSEFLDFSRRIIKEND